ncbi:DUF2203 domain-containing protein [Cohnella cellulosilytica]|uniref:DUF2203 domain-containing protein n=1 Tax=Cohnella cellulosilytica TaxID=986710 RepID=A0ABW2F183_9BACL
MEHKLFTAEEANELLPQIRRELAALQELAGKIESRHRDLLKFKSIHKHAFPDLPHDNDPFFEMESSLDFLRIEMDMMIRNFSRKGVLLKMIDPGLIDFPTMIEGEPALLCWKEGEERVGHYHGWHDGFVGRRALPEDRDPGARG